MRLHSVIPQVLMESRAGILGHQNSVGSTYLSRDDSQDSQTACSLGIAFETPFLSFASVSTTITTTWYNLQRGRDKAKIVSAS